MTAHESLIPCCRNSFLKLLQGHCQEVKLCSTPHPTTLTDPIGNAFQQVLGQQQIRQCHQPTDLVGQLLQLVLRHIQTHQAAEVAQLLDQRGDLMAQGTSWGRGRGGDVAEQTLTGGSAESWFRSSQSSRRFGSAPRVSGCRRQDRDDIGPSQLQIHHSLQSQELSCLSPLPGPSTDHHRIAAHMLGNVWAGPELQELQHRWQQ